MNRVLLALGSFVIGACFSFAASSLIHASTRAQRQGLVVEGAEPVVPPIKFFGRETRIGGDVQALDGISCDGCEIAASKITYAGGAASFKNCRIVSVLPIELKGAAENTRQFLMMVGALPKPQPNKPPKTNPNMQTATFELKPQDNFTLELVASK